MSYNVVYGRDRIERARRMYDSARDHHIARVLPRTNLWIVRSQRRKTVFYHVYPDFRTCDCPDFRRNRPLYARFVCKHLILVALVQRGGRLLRVRGRLIIDTSLHFRSVSAGTLADRRSALTEFMAGNGDDATDADGYWREVETVASANTADTIQFFARSSSSSSDTTHRQRIEVCGTHDHCRGGVVVSTWIGPRTISGSYAVSFALCPEESGLSNDDLCVLRYDVRGDAPAGNLSPDEVLCKYVAPAAERGHVVALTGDISPNDPVILRRFVWDTTLPGVVAAGGQIRVLNPSHAVSVEPSTGIPRCGHAHGVERLHQWLIEAPVCDNSLPPCPTCSRAGEMALLISAPKRAREAETQESLDKWSSEFEEALMLVPGESHRVKTSKGALKRLEPFTKVLILKALQRAPNPRADEFAAYLRALHEFQAWRSVAKPYIAMLLVARQANLPADASLMTSLGTVAWVRRDIAKLADTRQRAGDTKRQRLEEKDVVERAEEAPAPEDAEGEVVLARGGRTMFKQLEDETARGDRGHDLTFLRFDRDRCGGGSAPLRDLAIGQLASYQHVIEWAGGRMAAVVGGPQSLLLDWQTGAGKACAIWLVLGAVWRTPRFALAPSDPYRAKFLFVTTDALARKQDPAKDVWCFYRAAGVDAHAEIRATADATAAGRSPSKGNLWKLLLPAHDPTLPERGRQTRIISYGQLQRALLLNNDVGRALYGYELGATNQTGPLVRMIDRKQRIVAGDDDEDAGDAMMRLLSGTASKWRTGAVELETRKKELDARIARPPPDANVDELQRELRVVNAELAAALDPRKNPIDPLRDAVIAIDEADTLFSPDGALGDRVTIIERAVFHSYRHSGRNAVRLVLATATPSHTDIRSTFRLLNMLVVRDAARVHGCGTPGTDLTANPTIGDLAGATGTFQTTAMRDYMNAIQNSISHVNVEQDLDRFPVRRRKQIDVRFTVDDARADFDAALRRRFPPLRVSVVEEEEADPDQPFLDDDDVAQAIEKAVDDTAEDADQQDIVADLEAGDDAAAAVEASSAEVAERADVQQGLRQRATNLRRIGMALPAPGEPLAGAPPPQLQLGHLFFDPAVVVHHIAQPVSLADADADADAAASSAPAPSPGLGRAPKLHALLEQIRRTDAAWLAEKGYLPKHAIMAGVPGPLGAPLVGAALAAAGYYWRAMARHRTRGIVFPRPTGEAVAVAAAAAGAGAAQAMQAELKQEIDQLEALGDVDRTTEVREAEPSRIAEAERVARVAVWESDAVQYPPPPWLQPTEAPLSSVLPGPVAVGNNAFVVLDGSLLSMDLEQNYTPQPRSGYRAYADYTMAGVRVLEAMIPEVVRINPAPFEVARAAIAALARKPIYYDPTGSEPGLFTTAASSPTTDVEVVGSLQGEVGLLADLVGQVVTIQTLLERGIVRWAPRMTDKQRETAARVTLNDHFNDSDENFDGEFARLIVMAPEFTVGTDTEGVEIVHLLNPAEVVADGTDARVHTRDRIQDEGRAWRRCGHAELRRRRYAGATTEVLVLAYRLEGSEGVDADIVLDRVRARRPFTVPGIADVTRLSPRSGGAAAVPDKMHVDDMAQALRADPDEQALLSAVVAQLGGAAFDRVNNTIRLPSAPVFTGYVFTGDDTALYRMPGASTVREGFVTVDGEAWAGPDGRGGGDFSLLDLWRRGLARYERGAGSGVRVPDVEQRSIEESLLASLSADAAAIIRKQTELTSEFSVRRGPGDIEDPRTDADVLNERVGAAAARRALLTLADRRAGVQAAISLIGVEVLTEDARQLFWRAVDIDLETSLLPGLTGARRRATYAKIDNRGLLALVDQEGFEFIAFARNAVGTRDADRIVAKGGGVLTDLLSISSRLSHEALHNHVDFFHGQWGIGHAELLEAIRMRPIVPGQTGGDYRRSLFEKLAGAKSGRWRRLAMVAGTIFVPEWLEGRDKRKASQRVWQSLAIPAVSPRRLQRGGDSKQPLDVLRGLPRSDPVVSAALEVYKALRDVDHENRSVARRFADSYIADIEGVGARLPTDLYARLLRIAQRLVGVDVRDVVADYMMLSVVALRQVSEVRDSDDAVADAASRVRRGSELESAVLIGIAGKPAADALMREVDQWSESRGGNGLAVLDGVRALVSVDGDMRKAAAVLSDLADEGEFPSGLVTGAAASDFPDEPFGSAPAAGTPIFVTQKRFDPKNRSVRFLYFTRSRDSVKVHQLKGKTWAESVGAWIVQDRLELREYRPQQAAEERPEMFDRRFMKEVTLVALLGVLRDNVRPRKDTARSRAYTILVMEAIHAVGRGTPLSAQSLSAQLDTLWRDHGPGSDVSFAGHDIGHQRSVVANYGRSHGGVRLWPRADAISKRASALFPSAPGVYRRTMHALLNSKRESDLSMLATLDTDNASSIAAVLAGVTGPVEDARSEINLHPQPLIPQYWSGGQTQYNQVLIAAAATATAAGNAQAALLVGQGGAAAMQSAPLTFDVTTQDVIEWHMSEGDIPVSSIAEIGTLMGRATDIYAYVRERNELPADVRVRATRERRDRISDLSLEGQLAHWKGVIDRILEERFALEVPPEEEDHELAVAKENVRRIEAQLSGSASAPGPQPDDASMSEAPPASQELERDPQQQQQQRPPLQLVVLRQQQQQQQQQQPASSFPTDVPPSVEAESAAGRTSPAPAPASAVTGRRVLVWHADKKPTSYPDLTTAQTQLSATTGLGVPVIGTHDEVIGEGGGASLQGYDRVFIVVQFSKLAQSALTNRVARFARAIPRATPIMLLFMIRAPRYMNPGGWNWRRQTQTGPAMADPAPLHLTHLTQKLADNYGLGGRMPGLPFALLRYRSGNLLELDQVDTDSVARVVVFIASGGAVTATTTGTAEEPISIGSFAAHPMRIVRPEHCAGLWLTPREAEKIVWRLEGTDGAGSGQQRLVATAGTAVAVSGRDGVVEIDVGAWEDHHLTVELL